MHNHVAHKYWPSQPRKQENLNIQGAPSLNVASSAPFYKLLFSFFLLMAPYLETADDSTKNFFPIFHFLSNRTAPFTPGHLGAARSYREKKLCKSCSVLIQGSLSWAYFLPGSVVAHQTGCLGSIRRMCRSAETMWHFILMMYRQRPDAPSSFQHGWHK